MILKIIFLEDLKNTGLGTAILTECDRLVIAQQIDPTQFVHGAPEKVLHFRSSRIIYSLRDITKLSLSFLNLVSLDYALFGKILSLLSLQEVSCTGLELEQAAADVSSTTLLYWHLLNGLKQVKESVRITRGLLSNKALEGSFAYLLGNYLRELRSHGVRVAVTYKIPAKSHIYLRGVAEKLYTKTLSQLTLKQAEFLSREKQAFLSRVGHCDYRK